MYLWGRLRPVLSVAQNNYLFWSVHNIASSSGVGGFLIDFMILFLWCYVAGISGLIDFMMLVLWCCVAGVSGLIDFMILVLWCFVAGTSGCSPSVHSRVG